MISPVALAPSTGYRRDEKGGFDHSAAISLLDDKGEIIFQKVDADVFVAKIEALATLHK